MPTTDGNGPTLASLQQRIAALWPAAKGSLSEVRKPCVRKGCKACAEGIRHPAWLLTFRLEGKRRCVYVPREQVPALQQALANGREVERLLCLVAEAVARQGKTGGRTAP